MQITLAYLMTLHFKLTETKLTRLKSDRPEPSYTTNLYKCELQQGASMTGCHIWLPQIPKGQSKRLSDRSGFGPDLDSRPLNGIDRD